MLLAQFFKVTHAQSMISHECACTINHCPANHNAVCQQNDPAHVVLSMHNCCDMQKRHDSFHNDETSCVSHVLQQTNCFCAHLNRQLHAHSQQKKIHNAANQKQNSICSSTSMTKKRRRFFQFNSSDVSLMLCATLCNAKFHFFPQHHTKFDFTFHQNKHNQSTTSIMSPQKKLTREPRAKAQRDIKVSSMLKVLHLFQSMNH